LPSGDGGIPWDDGKTVQRCNGMHEVDVEEKILNFRAALSRSLDGETEQRLDELVRDFST